MFFVRRSHVPLELPRQQAENARLHAQLRSEEAAHGFYWVFVETVTRNHFVHVVTLETDDVGPALVWWSSMMCFGSPVKMFRPRFQAPAQPFFDLDLGKSRLSV